jgi:KDO2-lipid IV(A) lauroyltransferase
MLSVLLKCLSKLFGALPLKQALALGSALGGFYGTVIRHHRRDAVEALQRSLPEKNGAERSLILNQVYRNLGMNAAEEMRMPSVSNAYLKDYILWDDESPIREVLSAGKGLLALTAHVGNFDLLCTIAPQFNYPTTIITKIIKNKAINDWWMAARSRFGLKFVPAHNSYRQCLGALRKNEIVAFILDQNMINTEGIFVDFFGKPACTSPGLAYMSAQSGAAVVPVFMIRLANGHHRVKVMTPIPPPPDRKPETISHYTQLYTKIIEDVIREYPDQWIWVHRRWRTVPKTETPDALSKNNYQ